MYIEWLHIQDTKIHSRSMNLLLSGETGNLITREIKVNDNCFDVQND